MHFQLGHVRLALPQFTICCKQRLRLDTVHSSPTSCLYRVIKRSRARIKRIFTADALILSTSAISAQDSPSFSYNHKQVAYFEGNWLKTRSTISRSATRLSKRPPSYPPRSYI